LINPFPLAVTPGFTIDVSHLSPPAELDQSWLNMLSTEAVKVPPGWVPLLLEMFVAIQRIQKGGVAIPITKIFEDDGEMRVIYTTRSRAIHNLIEGYVKQAEETCENCSWPGQLTSVLGAGFSSYCPVCAFLFSVRSYR
jgi:hypothetical protein